MLVSGKRGMTGLRALAATIAALALLPACANASTASVGVNSQLTYAATTGETNSVSITSPATDTYSISDPGATITPGAGCTTVNANQVTCTSIPAIKSLKA